MGSSVIAPLIARYQQRFAQVEIELVEQRHGGLIEEGFDLAVRVGALPDSGMVARAVRPYQNRIYRLNCRSTQDVTEQTLTAQVLYMFWDSALGGQGGAILFEVEGV
jgi:DNA-binding transcriptional LysR family regulator